MVESDSMSRICVKYAIRIPGANSISPTSCFWSLIVLSSVVFPAPLCPTIPIRSPSFTMRLMSCKTSVGPKLLSTPSTVMSSRTMVGHQTKPIDGASKPNRLNSHHLMAAMDSSWRARRFRNLTFMDGVIRSLSVVHSS